MSAPTKLVFSAATDIGRKREGNEDNFLVDCDLGLFVVADGMGGHAAGEVASALTVHAVHEVLMAHAPLLHGRMGPGAAASEPGGQEVTKLLELAVSTASDRVYAKGLSDARMRGMGTTLSALLVLGTRAFVAHVGDSRIYLLRGGVVNQVTDDHTVARELVRLGMVRPEHLAQIPRKNAITRAVGVYAHVEVDTLSFDVLPNDRFLLCSDGLSGYLDDSSEPLAPFLELEDGDAAVRNLIAFANDRGGKDNITAVVVRVDGGDVSDGLRVQRAALKREVLAALPLFSRLNERQLMSMMAVVEVQSFAAGDIVMREGESGDAMFVILEGRCRVEKQGEQLLELATGAHFGEMALIRAHPRSATVTATVPSELLCFHREDFFDMLRGEPHSAVKLLWQFINVLAGRLEQTSEDLSNARRKLGANVRGEGLNRPASEPPVRADGVEGFLSKTSDNGGPALDFQVKARVAPTAHDGDERAVAGSGSPLASGVPLGFRHSISPVSSVAPPASDRLGAGLPSDAVIETSASVAAPSNTGEKPEKSDSDGERLPPPARAPIPTVRMRTITLTAAGAMKGSKSEPVAPPIVEDEAPPELPAEPAPAMAPAKPFRASRQTLRLDDAQLAPENLEQLRREFRDNVAAERPKNKDPKSS